ncbi:MAG: hypothetical protein KGJ13_10505 [Patescibacteria group bacterium]|nr:hypothetical protein [Patescibacteria group bacterium]
MRSQKELELRGHELFENIRKNLPHLRNLLADASSEWRAEDSIYRFYHQSFKVYQLQSDTRAIANALASLLPAEKLNDWFLQIVREGTGKNFTDADNDHWLEATRPILEAFFHAKYFLEMAVKYGEGSEPLGSLPSGWAALLCLYNIR